jgi:hypothetical protein
MVYFIRDNIPIIKEAKIQIDTLYRNEDVSSLYMKIIISL